MVYLVALKYLDLSEKDSDCKGNMDEHENKIFYKSPKKKC